MEVLTAQLRPHFLFNTLNSIAEMVHHDADRADRMVVGLSALLRNSIESESRQKIALQDELVLLLHYVEIEKVRLGERLQFTSEIGPESGRLLVPAFLLQPLVENCIVHGISKSETGGSIVVRANVAGEYLCIEIDDTGGGQVIVGAHRGVGLANTESRLRVMYGDRHEFSVQANDYGGTHVSIRVPASL
jgi:LytS/YehU family sensor histidine kinase